MFTALVLGYKLAAFAARPWHLLVDRRAALSSPRDQTGTFDRSARYKRYLDAQRYDPHTPPILTCAKLGGLAEAETAILEKVGK
jgi:hypothetical protein